MDTTRPVDTLSGNTASQASLLVPLEADILQALAEKKVTRDGNLPKRRGPKPNSRPALTRKQELNRQAQRTHRERKEVYIRALEDEILRLRDIFSHMSQDKARLADENQHLKTLLARCGVTITAPVTGKLDSASNASLSEHSYGSRRDLTPSLTSRSTASSASPSSCTHLHPSPSPGDHHVQHDTTEQAATGGLDYNQAGIDFVLTLEHSCMVHLPWLLDHEADMGSIAAGHILMASCPSKPFAHLTERDPFGRAGIHIDPASDYHTWKPARGDLAVLLDLSKKLDLDGEITPVMAWGMIMAHPRFAELRSEDFTKLAGDLSAKVRCYGFGAVMEEFEIRDALENVLCSKDKPWA